MIEFSDPIFDFFSDKFWGGPISRVPWGVQKFWGGPIRVPWGGPIGGPMLKSQKLGGSNVPIPKVGGVRTPPTRAVAAPMIFLIDFESYRFVT